MISIKNKDVFSLLALYLTFLTGLSAHAQKYGNEWVRPGQQYFKFPIYKEALYRLDSATLANYYDLSVTDASQFRLFLKGREVPLYVHGGNDNKINSGDYIEFYADNNVAEVDSLLYTDISYVPNPYVPLYTDSVNAFLTLEAGAMNKRFTPETDTAISLYPKASYVYAEKRRAYNYEYNDVRSVGGQLQDPRLTQAEGWGASHVQGGSDYSAFAPLPVYNSPTLNAYFSVAYSGKSTNNTQLLDHNIQISYMDNNNSSVLLSDTTFKGYTPVRRRFVIGSQDLGSSTEFWFKSVASPVYSANVTSLHYYYLSYPRHLNMNFIPTIRFYADLATSSGKAYYQFLNFNTGASGQVVLYDLSGNRRIPVTISTPYAYAVIPNGTARSMYFMSSLDSVKKVTKMTPVTFSNYRQTVTDAYVIIYHKSLESSAAAYKSYRESPAGGGYQVIMADVDRLYDQFGWGVRKHAVAIRRFAAYLKDSLNKAPRCILLIGSAAKNAIYSPAHSSNQVPTIGWPASDNLLTASLNYTGSINFYPDIPIGRIAAISNTQVTDYLSKVQQHESAGNAEWKKKVLHFIGGDSETLSNQLSAFMSGYQRTIEDTLFGAKVYTFKKTTTAPIQLVVSDSIRELINGGASLLTFFGHGSTQGFDQAIDQPEVYSNTGRYPFIVANSCYSGDIHDPNETTVSKRFLFAPQKGSIGFLASNSLGEIFALDHYSQRFYKALATSRYHSTVGEVIAETAYENQISGQYITKIASLDMTLHGDPGVRIGNGLLPDYQLQDKDVRFNLADYRDSLEIKVTFKNLSRALNDTMVLRVERILPGGDTSVVSSYVKAPYYEGLKSFIIPIDRQNGIGHNRFRVTVDYLNDISEFNESNNSTGYLELFIPGNDITPVYPYRFAVVPASPTLSLKASTTDPFAPSSRYLFQLDTNGSFLSPLQSTVITSKGGVIAWTVNLPFKDSTVYFWRVSRDSVSAASGYNWKESSFQTIGNSRGWSQAHFTQFRNNGYQLVTPDAKLRRFVFQNRMNLITTRTGIHPYLNAGQITYYFNNEALGEYSCTFNGWNFVVFDSVSGTPQRLLNTAWPASTKGPFNNCLCSRADKYLYAYYFGPVGDCQDTSWKSNALNFLNSVAPNNYVLAYTTGLFGPNYSYPSSYSNAFYSAFESIGSGNIRTLRDTVPAVIFGRKGMTPGKAHETVGTSKRSVLYTQDSIKTRWNSGYIASEQIGPATRWNSLHWRVKSTDASAGDTTVLELIGIRANGKMDTLRKFGQDSSDVLNLHQYADAAVYPRLKLVAYMRDNVHRTSPQLNRWQVLYEEAPECAVNPLKGFSSQKDSIQEGDQTTFVFPIENIGPTAFKDSLVVTYWIEDEARNITPLPDRLKPRPFVPGQLLMDTVKISSLQLTGKNALWISVNPVAHARYQTEQFQFNNIARHPFSVYGDVINPLLDVTFDGRRILNGDIVSARPEILITLKDENRFLALNDTAAFTVYMQSTGQSAQQRIYFAQGLQFTPASLPKNSASILYRPQLVTDGKYTLSVQARDRSRNASGAQDYRIQFEVDNRPAVTNVMNYPNPFTTATRFVFTLTGSEIPEVFTIQIMTVTGKVVREITRGELGTLRIGRNITEYAWDGRDHYGDRLANGIYLYRVITRLNGEAIEKRQSGADQFFTKEFGKMVLMR